MSYILDALKKADAERERDAAAVPDLHAQADVGADSARSPARGPLWRLGLGVAAVALCILAWRWFGAEPTEPSRPQALSQTPVPAPAPAPVPVPVLAPAPAPPAARSTVPSPMAAVTTTPSARPAAATPKPATAASVAAEPRLPTLAELPAELRSQLPALVVGGSMYSTNAASRIVILNGQVFREGDKPVDGLSVEQIRLKSTVLAFRGVRFELKH